METITTTANDYWVTWNPPPMTALEIRTKSALVWADFVRAKEQIHMYALDDKVKDTYTLIPNGMELTHKQSRPGQPPKLVPAYLVQHDQSGVTFKWCGEAASSYEHLLTTDEMWPFLLETKKWRGSWKERELKRIKLEGEKKMPYDPEYDEYYDNCDECRCDICIPLNKENNMNYATANVIATNANPAEERQRSYLHTRLYDVECAKSNELRNFFKLDPVKGPTTIKELIQKIKDGDFSYDEKKAEYDHYNTEGVVRTIRWTKDAADQAGYKKAMEVFNKVKQETQDTIAIASPEEGLKALRAFEAQTFH